MLNMHGLVKLQTLHAKKNGLAMHKAKVSEELRSALKSYERDDLTLDELHNEVKGTLTNGYKEAYRLGAKDQMDSKDLKRVQKEQFGYLDGFMEDIKNDEGQMDMYQRMEMYTNKLDAVHWEGVVDGVDETHELDWVTTAGESCDDCLELEEGGPYTKEDLPTTPGAGETECGPWCKCMLVSAE